MNSLSEILGLSSGSSLTPTSTPTPNLSPAYLILHFLFAYVFLSSRWLKHSLKIDNNVSPRENVSIQGVAAVKAGKITQKQLEMVKRNESAHANAMENYTLFVAAMAFGTVAGVRNEMVNLVGLSYTLARLGYAVCYLRIETLGMSYLRSVAWWWGNVSCLVLLWMAGRRL